MEKTGGKTEAELLNSYSRGKKDHPAVQAPGRKLYETEEQDGTLVAFYHTDHAMRFGIACADCHRREGCISCHDRRPERMRAQAAAARQNDFDAVHARCSSCHSDQACVMCHVQNDPGPFDHGRRTGWALKPYHASLDCAACHPRGKAFAGLTDDCTSCHTSWDAASFKHAVTGQALDEIHGALDCADCHEGRNFATSPSCFGCHPDKTYPASRPGKIVKR
jgi:hypothetical protein